MTKFRHLIWMIIAAAGLMLSVSQSFAQKPDVGDQPGLIADDSVELDPEYRRTAVLYRTSEAPGTIIIQTAERHLYLIQGNGRALRPRNVSRYHGLSHPRHQPARYDRHRGFVRLLPAGQCRRRRPL